MDVPAVLLFLLPGSHDRTQAAHLLQFSPKGLRPPTATENRLSGEGSTCYLALLSCSQMVMVPPSLWRREAVQLSRLPQRMQSCFAWGQPFSRSWKDQVRYLHSPGSSKPDWPRGQSPMPQWFHAAEGAALAL